MEDIKQTWNQTARQLFEEFKFVLNNVGVGISANEYDRLQVPGRPDRRTLERHTGLSWNQLKDLVYEESRTDPSTFEAIVRRNEQLRRELAKARDLRQAFIDNCITAVMNCSFKPAKIPPKQKSQENLECHAIRSDLHVGSKIIPEETEGLGHYDVETYEKRTERWLHKMVLFRDQDKTSLGLNKLVLNYLGDIVEGESIYPGQAFALDSFLFDQYRVAVQTEINAILTLAGHFPSIEIFCVPGNHGRVGKKGEHHRTTNFDLFFYDMIKERLKSQENVKVYFSKSPSMIVQHGTKTFLLNHGDNARGWMGIPYYSLERMFRRLPDLYGMLIDYELCAHHHQPANLAGKIYMNGSMVGGSDLSIHKMGLTNIPSQKIFYFHHKFGINRESDLQLADPVKLTPDSAGIFTPHE